MDYPEHHPGEHDCLTDNRSVDELLTFINGEKSDDTGNDTHHVKISSKAAKRHRQKMKKVRKMYILCSYGQFGFSQFGFLRRENLFCVT